MMTMMIFMVATDVTGNAATGGDDDNDTHGSD